MIRAALAFLAAFCLPGCSGGSGSAPAPATPWAFQYSPGMPAAPAPQGDGFAFDFPASDHANHVNYLVREAPALATRLAVEGLITASADAAFRFDTNPDNTCDTPASARLYFQRRGDDMSGAGPMQFYRWWATNTLRLAPGPFTLATALDPAGWSSVFGVRGGAALAEFEAAKADAAYVGLTFGGGCFAGHGVYVSPGSARFAVSKFAME